MRLEEWQKFIESQFLDDDVEDATPKEEAPEEPLKPEMFRAEPLKPVSPPPIAPTPEKAPPFGGLKPLPPPALAEPSRPANAPSAAPPIANYRAPSGTGEPTRLSPTAKESLPAPAPNLWGMETEIPAFDDFLAKKPAPPQVETKKMSLEAQTSLPLIDSPAPKKPRRIVKYRAKHAKNVTPEPAPQGLAIVDFWEKAPRQVQQLIELGRQNEAEVAQYSYKRPFSEERKELIERLLDPILSLEDAARILNVCPTTVRRYTNRGILTCYRKEVENSTRKEGEETKETRQRRFRLSDILAFLEAQQSALEADRKADAARLYPAENGAENKE